MKLKLGIKERLVLIGLLPKIGNFVNLRLSRDLEARLGFTAEQVAKHQIVTGEEGTIAWNPQLEEEQEFEFLQPEIELIKGSLEALESAERLHMNHMQLWDWFVEGPVPSSDVH